MSLDHHSPRAVDGDCPVDVKGKPVRGPRARPGVLILVALAGLGADQVSKAWAFATGGGSAGAREIVPGLLAGARAVNFGAAANLAAGLPLTPALCSLNALIVATVAARWAWVRRDRLGRAEAVGVGLLLAGLLGNSGDRLALGYVRDFLVAGALPGWIFNLADVFILAGTLGLLGSWCARSVGRRADQARSGAPIGPWRPEPVGAGAA
jgi:lipoprotein signal peptidase